jgi:hypothetical protein
MIWEWFRHTPDRSNERASSARQLRLIVACCMGATMCVGNAQSQLVENGVAITDPLIMAHLQERRFSIGALLFPGAPDAREMKNNNLFNGPLRTVGVALIDDIAHLPEQSLDTVSKSYFASAASKGHRFSATLLNDPKSGFVLTGIVNRMDRGYRIVDGISLYRTCGEIRFLYRFTYDVNVDGHQVASRLPFTMSIVLNARDPDEPLSCSEIAKRWQAAGTTTNARDLIAFLDSKSSPLSYIRPIQIDRIEVNIQLFRVPASIKTDFGGNAEYLLRVFRRAAPKAPFLASPLENQPDRAALLGNPKLLQSLKRWLFTKKAMEALDRGILDIPQRYLTTRAISVSPGGRSRSENQPFFDLVSDSEIEQAIAKFEASQGRLRTIRSVEGFKRRLNDLSCSGCHQTRAIAGFHFPGADPESETASNAVHVPGSAHFYGDLPRRAGIVADFAARKRPDFSRGFSARPDDRFRNALARTQILDGWGSVCYVGTDTTFQGWTCAAGLQCKMIDKSDRNAGIGTCVTANMSKVGDPVEFGSVSHRTFGDDLYERTEPRGPASPDNYQVPTPPSDRQDYGISHQGFRSADSSGGFPGGMLRINGCTKLPPEASCGRVAATGFNDCIAAGKPFTECLKLTKLAGLRACDQNNPCREDYICTAPYKDVGALDKGTCIPPYFMFQFRVDGHPDSFATQETLPTTSTYHAPE